MADNITVASILNRIHKDSIELVREGSKITFKDVYDSAVPVPPAYNIVQDSLKNYNQVQKHKQNLVNQIRNRSKRAGNDISALEADRDDVNRQLNEIRSFLMQNNRIQNEIKNMYVVIFKFQDTITSAYGREIQMVYIWNANGHTVPLKINHDDIWKYLRFDVKRMGYRFVEAKQEMPEVLNQLTKDERQSMELMSVPAEMESLIAELRYRFAAAKRVNSPYLLWRVQHGEWKKAFFSTFSYLYEAYLAALLDIQKGDTSFQNIIKSNNDYDALIDWFMTKYTVNIDTAAGFMSEDVDAGNGLFYGVKSSWASLPGATNIVTFALMVITKYEGGQISEAAITELQRIWDGHTVGELSNLLDTEIDATIEKLMSNITRHSSNFM